MRRLYTHGASCSKKRASSPRMILMRSFIGDALLIKRRNSGDSIPAEQGYQLGLDGCPDKGPAGRYRLGAVAHGLGAGVRLVREPRPLRHARHPGTMGRPVSRASPTRRGCWNDCKSASSGRFEPNSACHSAGRGLDSILRRPQKNDLESTLPVTREGVCDRPRIVDARTRARQGGR
jgi:hypothetical protein